MKKISFILFRHYSSCLVQVVPGVPIDYNQRDITDK